jgi:Arc/MetJ-type ribon-helix-helix transcriptional regulator
MEVRPTPEQEALIRHAVEAPRIDNAEHAAREALALWEEQERRRSEILAAVDIAQASIARGEGIEITRGSTRELAEDAMALQNTPGDGVL